VVGATSGEGFSSVLIQNVAFLVCNSSFTVFYSKSLWGSIYKKISEKSSE